MKENIHVVIPEDYLPLLDSYAIQCNVSRSRAIEDLACKLVQTYGTSISLLRDKLIFQDRRPLGSARFGVTMDKDVYAKLERMRQLVCRQMAASVNLSRMTRLMIEVFIKHA